MYGFQYQHHDTVIGRRRQGTGRFLPHDPQFIHPFLVFFRQFFFLVLGIPYYFFFIKSRLADYIHGNRRDQQIPVFLPAFFNLLFAPQTGYMQRVQTQLASGKIQQIEEKGTSQNRQQRPGNIRFMSSGFRYPEQQENGRNTTGDFHNLSFRKRRHDPLDRVDVKVTEKHRLYMHGSLPEVNHVHQHCCRAQQIHGKIENFVFL